MVRRPTDRVEGWLGRNQHPTTCTRLPRCSTSRIVSHSAQLAVGRSVLVLGAGVPFGTRDDLATVNVELGFHGRF